MTFLAEKQPWMRGRKCSQETADLFFDPASMPKAVAICETCRVRKHCLAYIMEIESSNARYGVWGGLTPEERRVYSKTLR